jgi:alpha-ketoglutarate-dependent taurine dioxygenase
LIQLATSTVSFADYGRTDECAHEYHRLLQANGFVLAVDVPDNFDHVSFLSRFGDFRPGPSGKLVDDIVPEPGMDDVYYGFNRMSLLPHTEGYEFDGLPPRYLALWCVTPPAGAGGETTIFDSRAVLSELSPAEKDYLYRTAFEYRASEGLRRRGLGQHNSHPMLTAVRDVELLRFSCNNIVLTDEHASARSFIDRVLAGWDRGHVGITYARNDLLQFDNWRILHSRNAYTDPNRHLRRVQIDDAPATRARNATVKSEVE